MKFLHLEHNLSGVALATLVNVIKDKKVDKSLTFSIFCTVRAWDTNARVSVCDELQQLHQLKVRCNVWSETPW